MLIPNIIENKFYLIVDQHSVILISFYHYDTIYKQEWKEKISQAGIMYQNLIKSLNFVFLSLNHECIKLFSLSLFKTRVWAM